MLSDERLDGAREALAGQVAAYRGAVETAAAQVRAYLAAHGARSEERAQETALELGRFAGGRIDVGRLAAVLGNTRVLEQHEEALVRQCAQTMQDVLARGDALFACRVGPGGDLRRTVEEALGDIGRAFGAALVFQAVKTGVYRAEQHHGALYAFPFRRWNRNERLLAPPLYLHVSGADLNVAALAEYLDGRQKIVLVVEGASAPAPLARLITPHLFVMQTDVPANIGRIAAVDGPAVAALLGPAAALFVHDPAAARLEVTRLRAEPPRVNIGGWSAWQQEEELALLRELAAAEALAAQARARADDAAAAPPDPVAVDELSAWMLAQAGFTGGAG